jgi:broad specificity phosphatase PhoE
MTDVVEFYWIRHGETQWNVDRRFQGQLNPPLNERGQHQAQLLAARLVSEGPFDLLVSSDLARAKQTAMRISEALEMPITAYYEELRERSVGRLHGLTAEEATLSYGPDFRKQELGQERREALCARAVRAAELLLKEHSRHKKILITSHGGLIRAFLDAHGLPATAPLQNTSITRVGYTGDGKWALHVFNDASHLAGAESESA